jgi:hypothetical protein
MYYPISYFKYPYTERKDIDLLLIFIAFFLSFWGIAGGLLFLFINKSVSVCFFAASALLVLAGIFVIVHGVFRKPDLSYLKTSGTRVETVYFPGSNNDVLITTGINPVSGKTMSFKSEECPFKPGSVLKIGDKIDVYVDPKNAGRYIMDFGPLEGRVNELQNGPSPS